MARGLAELKYFLPKNLSILDFCYFNNKTYLGFEFKVRNLFLYIDSQKIIKFKNGDGVITNAKYDIKIKFYLIY